MKDPDSFPKRMIVLPFDPEFLSSIFTPERLRLWRLLHRSKTMSITQLAVKLERDVSRVRQDLLILQRSHLVKMARKGNTIQVSPTADHIIVASP
jgi:predicted transcriptional regulator